jgi:hypothetical protein
VGQSACLPHAGTQFALNQFPSPLFFILRPDRRHCLTSYVVRHSPALKFGAERPPTQTPMMVTGKDGLLGENSIINQTEFT